jgi:hypothetical protein
LLLRFGAQGDQLAKSRLTPIDDGEFADEGGIRYLFSKGEGGKPPRVVYRGIGLDQLGTKVQRPSLTTKQLAEFEGSFTSDELDVIFTTQLRDGRLVLQHRKGEVVLQPLAVDEFSAPPAAPFDTLRFLRNGNREISGFTVSTPRARHIPFGKTASRR